MPVGQEGRKQDCTEEEVEASAGWVGGRKMGSSSIAMHWREGPDIDAPRSLTRMLRVAPEDMRPYSRQFSWARASSVRAGHGGLPSHRAPAPGMLSLSF